MPTDFKRRIIARFLFVIAMQMQAVVLGWQMYVLTQSAYLLGFIGLTEALPALGFAIYAGYYVDHHRPLPVYYKLLTLNCFSALLMCFCQAGDTGLSVSTKVATLFISAFITGTVRAFAHPTIYILVPNLVPREMILKAAAFSATTMQVARISGPAFGGLLFGYIGISSTALIVAGLLILAIIFATRIEHPPDAPTLSSNHERLSKKLLAGATFVWRHPILFPAMTLDMVSVFLGGDDG